MELSVNIHVKSAMPLASGISSTTGKEWKKQEFVGETFDRYPKTLVFSLFGNKLDENPIEIGKDYTVYFDLESRSYTDKNGIERWSTNVSAYKVEPFDSSQVPAENATEQQTSAYAPQQQTQQEPPKEPKPSEDLPF